MSDFEVVVDSKRERRRKETDKIRLSTSRAHSSHQEAESTVLRYHRLADPPDEEEQVDEEDEEEEEEDEEEEEELHDEEFCERAMRQAMNEAWAWQTKSKTRAKDGEMAALEGEVAHRWWTAMVAWAKAVDVARDRKDGSVV